MLTTLIYRSHIRDDEPVKKIEEMVSIANRRNMQSDVTGILLFNGSHFFQLLEGPEEQVKMIYRAICQDPRHYNIPGINAFTRCRSLTSIALSGSRIVTANQTDS